MERRRPLVVDIRRGSLDDGPGIRTVVFFKGCPLRCVFCHNPETQKPGPELAFDADRCVRCGSCGEICPRAALGAGAAPIVDRRRCDLCGRCEEVCPTSALRVVGRYWPADELAERLLRDEPFYRHSGGGVTLSGGECTMHPAYLESLLPILKKRGVHVALQTSGQFRYESFERRVLPFVDLVFFDVKVMDPTASRRFTRGSNQRALANLVRLLRAGTCAVRPRVPIVPGITDGAENMRSIVEHLCRAGASEVSLLPYNPLGLAMHARLGRRRPDLLTRFMRPDEEQGVIDRFQRILASEPYGRHR